MLFRLLITHAERLRNILHRLVAEFHGRYMGMHLFLRHRLLLQHIEYRHQHASCAYLGGYCITRTKEEILEHLKLMHEEWIIVRIDLTILGGTEGKTRNICYRLYHATVLGIISLQLLLTCIRLVEQTLTDNLVYLFCRYRDASLEACLHLFELTLIQSRGIEHIIEGLLGNANGPYTITQTRERLRETLQFQNINFLLCNRLTYLIDEEDYFILWMLFEIEREVFLQLDGIVCVDTFLRNLLSILKIFLIHDGYHRLTEHPHCVHHIAAQVSPLLAIILFLHFL